MFLVNFPNIPLRIFKLSSLRKAIPYDCTQNPIQKYNFRNFYFINFPFIHTYSSSIKAFTA